MNRNIKYKQVCRLMLFGDDDINTSTNSQYIVYPSSISTITVSSGGTNYTAAKTQITISGGGSSGTLASPSISGGVISAITMLNQGIGYTGQPNVIITSGLVNTTSLVGGTGYVLANTQITLSGVGGNGVIITPTIGSGIITALTITNAGSGYFNTPTITITSGITGTTSIVGGSGYTNGTFPLGISGGGGSGCIGTFTISSGGLTSISITNAGTGYTSAPTLSFPNAGGTGASATATSVSRQSGTVGWLGNFWPEGAFFNVLKPPLRLGYGIPLPTRGPPGTSRAHYVAGSGTLLSSGRPSSLRLGRLRTQCSSDALE